MQTILIPRFCSQRLQFWRIFTQTAVYRANIKVVKININFDSELAEKYEIQSAPTILFFKNGSEVSRLSGAVKKEELIETINNLQLGE